MRQALRRRTRLIGSALLGVFVVVFSVTCMARAEMTDAQKACCAAMAAGCGAAMAQEHGCCPTESPRFDQQLSASTRVVVPIPPVTTIVFGFLETGASPHADGRTIEASDSSPPRAPGVPPYLLISTLRI
jgi:hypothetical protein